MTMFIHVILIINQNQQTESRQNIVINAGTLVCDATKSQITVSGELTQLFI